MPDKKKRIRGDDPRDAATKRRNDCRELDFGGLMWQWKTNGYEITIYDPQNKKHDTDLSQVTGRTIDMQSLEKHPIAITPSMVSDYISGNLV